MPINTAPGFWGNLGQRLKQGAPGMMNAMAQNYGDPRLRGAAQMTGLIASQRKQKLPSKRPGAASRYDVGYKPPVMQNPPGMPQAPVEPRPGGMPMPGGGIVRPPMGIPGMGEMPSYGGGMNRPMPMPFESPGNTGISGMGFPGGINPGTPEIGGFWNTYNRLAGLGGGNTGMGQLFY